MLKITRVEPYEAELWLTERGSVLALQVKPDSLCFMAFKDGKGVSLAILTPDDDTSESLSYFTDEAHRRKGYALATVRHTVKQSVLDVIATAISPESAHLLQRLGFEQAGTFTWLSRSCTS